MLEKPNRYTKFRLRVVEVRLIGARLDMDSYTNNEFNTLVDYINNNLTQNGVNNILFMNHRKNDTIIKCSKKLRKTNSLRELQWQR